MTPLRTTLVTGANSGLGLEAARQLLARSGEHVVITARSRAKANAAIDTLVRRTGAARERIDSVLADYTAPDTVERAVAELAQRGVRLDGVILNAGGAVDPTDRTPQGFTRLFAMNVGGHAQLLHGLLEAGALAPHAAVVFAASEASRGIPAMSLVAPSLPELPGSVRDVVAGVARGDHLGERPDTLTEYGLVKLIGNAWMRHLAATHAPMRFYAISPGASAGTAGTKEMPALMGFMMKYVMFPAFRMIGRAHGVEKGAARYLVGLDDASLHNGAFYASRWPHMSGPLVEQDEALTPLLADDAFVAAVGAYVEALAGELRAAA